MPDGAIAWSSVSTHALTDPDPSNTNTSPQVIMDGGGNDVISVRSDCEAFNGNCVRQIDEAVAIGKDLLKTLHDAGTPFVPSRSLIRPF